MESNSSVRSPLAVMAMILGGSLILATVVGAYSFYRVRALADVISVTGSAQKDITSDVAKWRLSINRTTTLTDLSAGYAAMKKDLDAVRAYLDAAKVDSQWITVEPVTMNTITNTYGSEPTGYSLTQGVVVEGGDIARITKLAQEVGSLAEKGAIVSTQSLEYYYSKLADTRIELLASATKDAQARAAKIAESAGSGLGSLKEAAMGVIQVTSRNSVDVSDYGSYDTSAIEKRVTAVVRASFGVR